MGLFWLFAAAATSLIVSGVHTSLWENPLGFLLKTTAMSVGVGAVGYLFGLCLAVVLFPLGWTAAWSLRQPRASLPVSVVFSGLIATISLTPVFLMLEPATVWEVRSLVGLAAASGLIGQLAGAYARDLRHRRVWSRVAVRRILPCFGIGQALSAVAWLAVLFTALHHARLNDAFALWVLVLVPLQAATATGVLLVVAIWPHAREETVALLFKRYQGLKQADADIRQITSAPYRSIERRVRERLTRSKRST